MCGGRSRFSSGDSLFDPVRHGARGLEQRWAHSRRRPDLGPAVDEHADGCRGHEVVLEGHVAVTVANYW